MVKITKVLCIKYNLTAIILYVPEKNRQLSLNLINKKFKAMNTKQLILIILFPIIIKTLHAQSENQCRVLHENLQVFYEGDCKDGLAHGEGFAKGIDEYKGKFKNGLPHGQGKYKWSNGDCYDGNWKNGEMDGVGVFFDYKEDKTIEGKWKNNKFVKEISKRDYKILIRNNLNSITIKRDVTGRSGDIVLSFKGNNEVEFFSSLELAGNSGFVTKNVDYIAFKDVDFPFEGTVAFIQSGKFVVPVKSELKFIINEPGAWNVIINYGQVENSVNYDQIINR